MVDRVVLDVELGDAELLGQPRRAHQRRETRVETCLGLLDRQQLQIAPERSRPRLDQFAADHAANGVVVVGHFERTQALGAHPRGLQRIRGPAQVTGQAGDESHTVLPCADTMASGIALTRRDGRVSVRTVAGTPAALVHRRQQLLDARRRHCARRLTSSATDGPAPDRNAPRTSGSSMASTSPSSGTSDARAG